MGRKHGESNIGKPMNGIEMTVPDVVPPLTKLEYFTAAALQGLCARTVAGDFDTRNIPELAVMFAKKTLNGLTEEKP